MATVIRYHQNRATSNVRIASILHDTGVMFIVKVNKKQEHKVRTVKIQIVFVIKVQINSYMQNNSYTAIIIN